MIRRRQKLAHDDRKRLDLFDALKRRLGQKMSFFDVGY